MPERKASVGWRASSEILAAKDSDDTSRMRELRDAGEQHWLDILTRPEHVDGLETRSHARVDEVLAFRDEEPEPLPLARGLQPPD